jgi:creatinine amidohydrolase
MHYRLADITWPEVEQAVADGATTLILPLGATEQHGPHLPLGTDSLRAAALAERVAARLPGALVAPVLPVGCSDEHTGFAGLLSLEAETLAAVIVDCARRMVAWGVRKLVLLSAHGGNGQALVLAAERLTRELPDLQLWTPGDLLDVGGAVLAVAEREGVRAEAIGLHAGEGETSEVLHLRPDLVRRDQAAPGFTGDMAKILPWLYAVGLRPVTPSGVLGDPTDAEPARGERYLDARAAEIAATIE